jgi:hypothetical protein
MWNVGYCRIVDDEAAIVAVVLCRDGKRRPDGALIMLDVPLLVSLSFYSYHVPIPISD